MVIDTHMHINSLVSRRIEEDINEINSNDNLDKVINIGVSYATSKEAVSIANNNSKFYATIGIHPSYVIGEEVDNLISIIDNENIVAIGEIGLDLTSNNIDLQREYLVKQIDIANNYHLPVVIHANKTNQQILEVFNKIIKPEYGCVFHCFEPEIEILKELIKEEYFISFAGRVTYKNAKRSLEIAKYVPSDLYLVETDSPYISPVPKRYEEGKSEYIKYIIERLAEIRNTTVDMIEKETSENALRLFKRLK